MGSKLTAYHGGSGMWSVTSAGGKRSYSVTINSRGKMAIKNRRGAVLNPNGPTAQEIQRAIKTAQERTASIARGSR